MGRIWSSMLMLEHLGEPAAAADLPTAIQQALSA